MDKSRIEELMKLMQMHGFNELELEHGKEKIRLVRQGSLMPQPAYGVGGFQAPASVQVPAPAPQPSATTQDATPAQPTPSSSKKYREIRSPFVGTFYASAAPGADPFAPVGKQIKKGDTLCIVEAMKLMNEIESEFAGTIVKVLVNNEEPVEYDQVLFLVE